MLTIRKFEELLLKLFTDGKLFGTTHSYIGQEAIACSVVGNLNHSDQVISNHRCHGHFIEKTDDLTGILAEIMGKEGGVSSGKGGSQQLRTDDFMSSGIQGNLFPVSVGMAYANKKNENDNLVVIFIGDGTLGQGIVYESLNLISLLSLPILVVIENNQYAQTTPISMNLSGSISKRIEAFDLSCNEQDVVDPSSLHQYFFQKITDMRKHKSPHVEILNTYRLGPHSKGDDFRDASELNYWAKKDPLLLLQSRLNEGLVNAHIQQVETRLEQVYKDVDKRRLVGSL